MNNETKQDVPPQQAGPPNPPPAEASPTAPADPWLAYLTDEKASARKFVSGMKKSGIRVPDMAARHAFAEALFAGPSRIKRLLALMQESARASETIRGFVFELAEAGIRRIESLSLPESLNDTNYSGAIDSWLDSFPKRPLKPKDLQVLFLLLRFGLNRRLLTEDTAFALLASAVRAIPKRGTQPSHPTTSATSPIGVMLAAKPAAPVPAILVAHGDAWHGRQEAQDQLLGAQRNELSRLSMTCAEKDALIAQLRATIVQLEASKEEGAARIAELEKQIVDLDDGWQHKLDELRGRVRGTMAGQLTRWMQTALDASRSDPPFANVIEERLEDALKLIERELKWLQPSA